MSRFDPARFLPRTRNEWLAAAALLLGLLALVARPAPTGTVTLDTRELAALVQREADHVRAGELAGWIIEGRADYRLVDLRDAAAFAAYHIPGAENIPLAALADATLLRNEKIVLYSEGGIHGAQAWVLMRARGYRTVYSLLGGLDAWTDEVLHPVAPGPAATAAETAEFQRAVEIARHFGGEPRAAPAPGALAGGAVPGIASPAAPGPTPSAGITPAPIPPPAAGRVVKKAKKEGC